MLGLGKNRGETHKREKSRLKTKKKETKTFLILRSDTGTKKKMVTLYYKINRKFIVHAALDV